MIGSADKYACSSYTLVYFCSRHGSAAPIALLPPSYFPLTIWDWITLILSLSFETFDRKRKKENKTRRRKETRKRNGNEDEIGGKIGRGQEREVGGKGVY